MQEKAQADEIFTSDKKKILVDFKANNRLYILFNKWVQNDSIR